MAPEHPTPALHAACTSPAEVLVAAAHASRNVSALLEAAEEFLLAERPSAGRAQAPEALIAAKWRLRALSAALELASLEPADIAFAAGQAPQRLSACLLQDGWREATVGTGLSWSWAPDLLDCTSLIDRATLTSVILCLVECIRHCGHAEAGMQATWHMATGPVPAGSSPGPRGWLWRFSPALRVPSSSPVRRSDIHEHALAHAGQLLPALGLSLDLTEPGHTVLRLVPATHRPVVRA